MRYRLECARYIAYAYAHVIRAPVVNLPYSRNLLVVYWLFWKRFCPKIPRAKPDPEMAGFLSVPSAAATAAERGSNTGSLSDIHRDP